MTFEQVYLEMPRKHTDMSTKVLALAMRAAHMTWHTILAHTWQAGAPSHGLAKSQTDDGPWAQTWLWKEEDHHGWDGEAHQLGSLGYLQHKAGQAEGVAALSPQSLGADNLPPH